MRRKSVLGRGNSIMADKGSRGRGGVGVEETGIKVQDLGCY